MGAVVSPSDTRRGKKRIIRELAQDLDPASREAVMRVYEEWKGEESEKELNRILGKRLAKRYLQEK